MKYSITALALGFFTALSAAAPTPDTDGPDPSQVSITGITYGGTGCPAGSTSIKPPTPPDSQAFTLIFDGFQATVGSGTPKNCNVNFQIHYPSGWQYTLNETDFTGYAQLEQRVTAKLQTSYWFAGLGNNKPTFDWSLPGPYDNNYTYSYTFPSETTTWSPCGAPASLNINTQLAVTSSNPNAHGLINIKYQRIYGVKWRKCL